MPWRNLRARFTSIMLPKKLLKSLRTIANLLIFDVPGLLC